MLVDKRLLDAFEQGYIFIKGKPQSANIISVNYDGVVVNDVQNGYNTTVTYTLSTFGTWWGLRPEDILE
jgi:hypothetical protein